MWCCWVTCSRPSAFSSADPLFIVSGLCTSSKPFRHNTTYRFFPFSQIWFPYLSRLSFFLCSPHTIWLWNAAIHGEVDCLLFPTERTCCAVFPCRPESLQHFVTQNVQGRNLNCIELQERMAWGFNWFSNGFLWSPLQSRIYVLVATKNWRDDARSAGSVFCILYAD